MRTFGDVLLIGTKCHLDPYCRSWAELSDRSDDERDACLHIPAAKSGHPVAADIQTVRCTCIVVWGNGIIVTIEQEVLSRTTFYREHIVPCSPFPIRPSLKGNATSRFPELCCAEFSNSLFIRKHRRDGNEFPEEGEA